MGYLLIKKLSDRTRLIIACVLFDGSLIGMPITMITTNEPKWVLALSWIAITTTAADIIYSVIIINRQKEKEGDTR